MISVAARNAVDRLVRDGWNTNVNLAAVDLIVLAGFLQLAAKHPSLTPRQVADCRRFVAMLTRVMRDREPAIGALIDAGDESAGNALERVRIDS